MFNKKKFVKDIGLVIVWFVINFVVILYLAKINFKYLTTMYFVAISLLSLVTMSIENLLYQGLQLVIIVLKDRWTKEGEEC